MGSNLVYALSHTTQRNVNVTTPTVPLMPEEPVLVISFFNLSGNIFRISSIFLNGTKTTVVCLFQLNSALASKDRSGENLRNKQTKKVSTKFDISSR
jgi:hypothetical protein